MKKIVIKILGYFAVEHNLFCRVYLKLACLGSKEYGGYLKKKNFLYSMGDNCTINPAVNITDPQLVKIGNNVALSACTLLCHDGVIGMMSRLYNEQFDAVGKIEIGNNVFIGHGSIVMPNVLIGSNVVVAAGSVVTKNIESGLIVAGIPAKPIGKLDDLATKLKERTLSYPWAEKIMHRKGAYDPELEPELLKMRQEYFFK